MKTPSSTHAENISEVSSTALYWRLLRYIKPYKISFLLCIFGFAIFAWSQTAMASFLEYLLDFIASDVKEKVYLPSLIIIGIVSVRSVGAFLGNFYIAKISFRILDTLRVQIFNRLMYMPGRYFDTHESGHLMSIIIFNVNSVTTAASDALRTLIREGATVIGLLIYLFVKNWRLTLMLFIVAPVIAILVNFVGKRLRKLSTEVQHSMGEITQVSSEMINGYRVMRSFGGEDYERQRFATASWKNYLQNVKIALTSGLNTPLLQLLVALSMGLLLWVAFAFISIPDAAAFAAYFTAVGMVLRPVRQLSEVIPIIQKGVAAADSIFNVLDEAPELDTGKHSVARVRGDISIENMSFTYERSDLPALKNINLQVAAGEVVALVGRSGSGKSTLVSLLARFYDASEGSICIDGVNIQDYKLKNLRSHIALVTQQVILFNDTILRNIAYGDMQDTNVDAVQRAADAAYATEFIEKLPDGFKTLVGEGGSRLSGGQRQRLAIARAILKDAPILILDEATSALDNESERYIQAALETVSRGRTTFIVAHRLSTIEKADRIIVMNEGEIVEQGTHKQLLAKQGHYARLHSAALSEV